MVELLQQEPPADAASATALPPPWPPQLALAPPPRTPQPSPPGAIGGARSFVEDTISQVYRVEYSIDGPSFLPATRHFLDNVDPRYRADGAIQKQMVIPGIGRATLVKRQAKDADGNFLPTFECTAQNKSWKLFATLVTPKTQA